MALGTGGILASASPASAAGDGFGLHIVDRNEADPRMWYYRFSTDAIGWNPGVNVLLPDDYHTGGRTYPVLYLLHGGGTDQDFITFDRAGIRDWTAGKPVIVVMPDGGHAGWYSNPVSSNTGARNWETFHINQLLPWIDANFRTYAECDGRAVAGFSMGGFGALKYAAKYYGHFASVSAHSGPASLRRDSGLVAHWANASSAALDLGGGTVYGIPLWDEARVSADNPVERVESYRNKRIFLVAGTSPDPVNWFDTVNENQVLAGQREFRARLGDAGIPHEWYEEPGGHMIRDHMVRRDLDGIIARLRKAWRGRTRTHDHGLPSPHGLARRTGRTGSGSSLHPDHDKPPRHPASSRGLLACPAIGGRPVKPRLPVGLNRSLVREVIPERDGWRASSTTDRRGLATDDYRVCPVINGELTF